MPLLGDGTLDLSLYSLYLSMIHSGTSLFVLDNSGARLVKCIQVYGHRKSVGSVGTQILVSVRQLSRKISQPKVKVSQVVKAVITGLAAPKSRKDGLTVHGSRNTCVLLSANGTPIGSRIGGPVNCDTPAARYAKVLALAPKAY